MTEPPPDRFMSPDGRSGWFANKPDGTSWDSEDDEAPRGGSRAGSAWAGLAIALTTGLALALIAVNSVAENVVLVNDEEFRLWLGSLGVVCLATSGLSWAFYRAGQRRTGLGVLAGAIATPVVAVLVLFVYLTLNQS